MLFIGKPIGRSLMISLETMFTRAVRGCVKFRLAKLELEILKMHQIAEPLGERCRIPGL